MNYGITANYEGYMALAVAILAGCSPEAAFNRLSGKFRRVNTKWDDALIAEVEIMREGGMLWREIAEKLGTTASTAHRMYNYPRKVKK